MMPRMLNHALTASFADASEQRYSDRRVLRLEAKVATPAGEEGVRVHNLSRTGMLVECVAAVEVGASIEVELPDGKIHRAEIVWADEGLVGCRFEFPLSQATLSAALLRSAPETAADAVATVTAAHAKTLEKLRQTWATEEHRSAANDTRLPMGKRMWVIGGLALAGWAVPAASAWAFF